MPSPLGDVTQLQTRIGILERQLQRVEAECHALRVARDSALKIAANWPGRPVAPLPPLCAATPAQQDRDDYARAARRAARERGQ